MKVLAAKPDYPELNLGPTHMVGENYLLKAVPRPSYVLWYPCVPLLQQIVDRFTGG